MAFITMAIPNEEVAYIYENTIRTWFEKKQRGFNLLPLFTAMEEDDTGRMEKEISNFLAKTIQSGSYRLKITGLKFHMYFPSAPPCNTIAPKANYSTPTIIQQSNFRIPQKPKGLSPPLSDSTCKSCAKPQKTIAENPEIPVNKGFHEPNNTKMHKSGCYLGNNLLITVFST